jgi:hypothetical protein
MQSRLLHSRYGDYRLRTLLPGLLLAGALMLSALIQPAQANGGGIEGTSSDTPPLFCETAIKAAESARNMPLHLLQAIAFTESGYMSTAHGHRVAWPWTVMAEGKGRYYPTKAKAIAAVQALQARGIGNIDVGCMQINLHYHGDAFSTLDQAFDPVHNVAYATAFLLHLRGKANSWTKAIKQYHSRNRERQFAYRTKVNREWKALRHGRAPAPVTRVTQVEAPKDDTATATKPGSITGAQWPPRDYAAQIRLQNSMRARLLSAQP